MYWADAASIGPVQARYWQLMACLQGYSRDMLNNVCETPNGKKPIIELMMTWSNYAYRYTTLYLINIHHIPINIPVCASTGPVLGRCCQHRTSTGPVLATNGMFTGLLSWHALQCVCAFTNACHLLLHIAFVCRSADFELDTNLNTESFTISMVIKSITSVK